MWRTYLLMCLYLTYIVSSHAQSVNFHAWGGSPQVNAYLQWVKEEVKVKHGITLHHIKLADTSDAVSRVLAEKAAGKNDHGAVDLIWINGENFLSMQSNHLLHTDWVSTLSNFALTNADHNPAMLFDFGTPTNGQEAPWGKASMVFYYNQVHLKNPPDTIHQLLTTSAHMPGRFTYPQPVDFLGISFLKYALIALNKDNTAHQQWLYEPVNEERFAMVSQVLWQYLDQLHPTLWRNGKYFIRSGAQLKKLFDDSEILIGFTFNATEIPGAVMRYDLPASTRSFAMKDGSLSNVHFVGITYNSGKKEAAATVVNFLLSPEAQAKKQRIDGWGDQTVLDVSMLSTQQTALFSSSSEHPSMLPAGGHFITLAEPHPSWAKRLREDWFKRYAGQ